MKKIFISYRREDTVHQTGRLFDHLAAYFEPENIFYDKESIGGGEDFRLLIEKRLSDTDVVIAPIGDQWLQQLTSRDEAKDVLILELKTALNGGVPIIPVLVANAPMPKEEDLPLTISGLHRLNAIHVRPDPDFRSDTDRLIQAIENTKKARRIPSDRESPTYASLAYAQEQLARLLKWGWYDDGQLADRIRATLEILVGTSAHEQIDRARAEWPVSGFAMTADGRRWSLFSWEWESGPGRDVHKRCLAMYIVGDSIEAIGIYDYVGHFFGGFSNIENRKAVASAGGFEIGDITEVG